jgi:transcriptional regulator with XRE-family HTH domain
LGWPRRKLAAKAGLSLLAVANFECGESEPRDKTMQAIADALTFAGIEFLGGKRPGASVTRKSISAEGATDRLPNE